MLDTFRVSVSARTVPLSSKGVQTQLGGANKVTSLPFQSVALKLKRSMTLSIASSDFAANFGLL